MNQLKYHEWPEDNATNISPYFTIHPSHAIILIIPQGSILGPLLFILLYKWYCYLFTKTYSVCRRYKDVCFQILRHKLTRSTRIWTEKKMFCLLLLLFWYWSKDELNWKLNWIKLIFELNFFPNMNSNTFNHYNYMI